MAVCVHLWFDQYSWPQDDPGYLFPCSGESHLFGGSYCLINLHMGNHQSSASLYLVVWSPVVWWRNGLFPSTLYKGMRVYQYMRMFLPFFNSEKLSL